MMLEYARTWGDSDAPTVVLLHPAGETRHVWTPHAENLQENYHVVSLDLPAHGIHPRTDFSFERAVDDIEAILDEVGSCVVGGHSMGGYVAMQAAAEHQDCVDGLLLGGAAYNFRTGKGLAISAVQYPLSYVLDVFRYSDRLSDWVDERFGEEVDEQQQPPEHEDTYDGFHGEIQSIRAGMFLPTWPYVEAYGGPVLIAHGEEEALQAHAEELADRVGGELAWYEGGHQAPVSTTQEFAEITKDFLDDVYANKATASR
jgi:pimeloyl-ACP methyl ester carboxylesterase